MKSKKSLYRIRKKIEKRAAKLLIQANIFKQEDWEKDRFKCVKVYMEI